MLCWSAVVSILFFPHDATIRNPAFAVGVHGMAPKMPSSKKNNNNNNIFQHRGWRVAMDIGREARTGNGMPSDWAASGCRIPVKVQCDFVAFPEDISSNDGEGDVVTLVDNVRFTGPDGEVVYPVQGGTWKTVAQQQCGGGVRDISFTLNFPETLVRRDATLPSGTVRCQGRLYSEGALQTMNDRFYEARGTKWDAAKEVNDINQKKEAPKKWNPQTEQWEKRYQDEGLVSQMTKLASLASAQRAEQKILDQRPNPNKDLSLDCGPFPGISDVENGEEGNVYFHRSGTVFLQKKGIFGVIGGSEVVIGTWSAEPINDKPKSYF